MRFRKVIWVLTVLWMSAIFISSSRPVEISRQDSAWLLERANIISQDEALDLDNPQAMSLQMWIRKTAHVIIFGALGILFYISCYGYTGKAISTGIVSWALATVYGMFDELHQYFVGRGAQWADVVRDSKGAFWGCVIITAIFLVIENWDGAYKWIHRFYNLDAENKFKKSREAL